MNKKLKLNLGCGTYSVKDWINIDNSLNARLSYVPGLRFVLWKLGFISRKSYKRKFDVNNIKFFDITKKFPFSDNIIDYIYSSHTLEHLLKSKCIFTLKECYRVLKVGGILRIVVPDLFNSINKYLEEYKNKVTLVEEKKFPITLENDVNKLYHTETKLFDHKYMYDYITLSNLLFAAGFRIINRKKALESAIQGIKVIEKRIDNIKNLYVECIK